MASYLQNDCWPKMLEGDILKAPSLPKIGMTTFLIAHTSKSTLTPLLSKMMMSVCCTPFMDPVKGSWPSIDLVVCKLNLLMAFAKLTPKLPSSSMRMWNQVRGAQRCLNK